MPTEMTREEVRHAMYAGVQLVEVLPFKQFADEHLPGAINIPLKNFIGIPLRSSKRTSQ